MLCGAVLGIRRPSPRETYLDSVAKLAEEKPQQLDWHLIRRIGSIGVSPNCDASR